MFYLVAAKTTEHVYVFLTELHIFKLNLAPKMLFDFGISS